MRPFNRALHLFGNGSFRIKNIFVADGENLGTSRGSPRQFQSGVTQMKYILYYRHRLGEDEASHAAMEQQREGAELLKSSRHETEAEYIEYEAAPPGQPELEPRPKLRLAFDHVAKLRAAGHDAQLTILRIGSIGEGDAFECVDESARTPENPVIEVEYLDASGEAGELLHKYRGVIDPDWGFEYALHQISVEDLFRRKRRRATEQPRRPKGDHR
jgi:hypothetical protein